MVTTETWLDRRTIGVGCKAGEPPSDVGVPVSGGYRRLHIVANNIDIVSTIVSYTKRISMERRRHHGACIQCDIVYTFHSSSLGAPRY